MIWFGAVILGASIVAAVKARQANRLRTPPPNSPPKSTGKKTSAAQPPSQPPADGVEVDENRARQTHEKIVNQNLTAAGSSLALSVLSNVAGVPMLDKLAIPGLIYVGTPLTEDGLRAIFKEKKIRASILDMVSIAAMLGTGNIFACSLAVTLLMGSDKLLLKTRDDSRKKTIHMFVKQPKQVLILRNHIQCEIPIEQVKVGDTVIVHAGEYIPTDGIILQGDCSVDQHQLTGEAKPVEKTVGALVFAGTMLISGRIHYRVEKAGEDTVIAQLGEILNRTANYESAIQSRGETIADKAVLPTIVMSGLALTAGIPQSLAVLNAGFGYNMRLIAPLGMLNFLTIAANEGILIKDGRSLDLLGKIDTVVFDKTGTLTLVEPEIVQIRPTDFHPEHEILRYAAACEYRQTHPIARAILQAAKERHIDLPPTENIQYEVGYGIQAEFEGQVVKVGSNRFMQMEGIATPADPHGHADNGGEPGSSFVYVAVNDRLSGIIELRVKVRPEVKSLIKVLHEQGKQLAIVSGDHEQPTRMLARELGIERVFAEVLPEDKANLVMRLQQEGRSVCFVGDGINDAIALKKAHVSVSLSGATTAARDSAQIVLMGGDLNQLLPLFELGAEFDRNMNASFMTTLVPGLVCVGGAFFLRFGVLTSIMLYNTGLVAGVGNAMLPRLKRIGHTDQTQG
ncbi:Potassium-transporting ATPase ATP-binding subunit [Candidatus Magnetaquicoccaceae bacterium FCR-1]|uniref:P-type Zn(2+) transporter n=1 Tax=Candidatus Magnetaquiglobus chichijimensis TaxID=3141448 RepID=A0ABQ0CAU0_9PROT